MARGAASDPTTGHPANCWPWPSGADNGLQLVSAVAGAAIALWPADRTVPGRGDAADRRT
jgi:hypothetical protein